MKQIYWILFLSLAFGGKIKIISSTTDLADIAKSIGGNRVTVTSIARGNQDPHYVEVLPSYMVKVKRADIYLKVGLELDLWAQQIIDGSRNRNIQVVDCSQNILAKEKPTGKVNASMGDIHRFGNPHYWLDPENGKVIAAAIRDVLIARDPSAASTYRANYTSFATAIDSLLEQLVTDYASLSGKKIIFFHNSWPYFADRFGLRTVAFIEPLPGIPPSPGHLDKIINIITSDSIYCLALESYFNTDAVDFISRKTGVPYIKLSQSVGALDGVDSYFDLFRYNLQALREVNHDQ